MMPVYVVGLEVRNGRDSDDYSGLQRAMAKLERHAVMPGLYLVSVPLTAAALKQYLLGHMRDEGHVWISRLPLTANNEFAYQTTGGTSAWLKKHSRFELPAPPAASRPLFFNASHKVRAEVPEGHGRRFLASIRS
jgi:hypothetical protein